MLFLFCISTRKRTEGVGVVYTVERGRAKQLLYLVSLPYYAGSFLYIDISMFSSCLPTCVFLCYIFVPVYLCICCFIQLYIFVYNVRQGEQLSVAGWSQGWRDPVLPAPLLGSLLLLPPPWLALPASLPACLAGHPAGEIRYCAISLSSVLGEQVCLCEPRNVFPCETM